MKRFICPYILLALLIPGAAAPISGPYTSTLAVSAGSAVETEIVIEDIFGVAIEGDMDFIAGFDLELHIAPALAQYRDSFALFVYQGVTPSPSEGVRRYSGEELGFSVLPPSRREFIRYSFPGETGRPSDPDITVFHTAVNPDKLPLLCTVLPVMKGIPNSLYREKIKVIAKPVVKDVGALSLLMNNEHPVLVRIDDTEIKGPWQKILLSPGLHTVSIHSEHYSPLTKQIGVERGKTAVLNLELVKTEPRIIFEINHNAAVYLDGEKILEPGKERTIAPGDHSIVINIGDYSLTQSLKVEGGRVYRIQLSMDIVIKVD
ncbi:MAG: PEGA domain-containing protein [Spirochaetales bacterium]|nr:PEGA domain-containing protein [Spirochaetales bacterium]